MRRELRVVRPLTVQHRVGGCGWSSAVVLESEEEEGGRVVRSASGGPRTKGEVRCLGDRRDGATGARHVRVRRWTRRRE